ncbi:MAG: CARDB domain-containing protein, partial [Coraliomargarita sp.]
MMIKKFRFRGRLKQLGTSVVACVLACVLNAQPTPQVETGDDFTIVLDAGGNLYSFGSNESGQLGVEGAPSPSPNPLLIEPSGGWEQVAVSRGPEPHVLAIRNGALWAWGSNDRGQLGDGTQENSDVPVQISLETNWVEVAVGEDFSMARNELGLVYLWGDNTYGQLGFGPVYNDPAIDIVTTVPNTPLDLNSYIAISAGKAHAHAIRSDGTLWAWGIGNVPTGGNELGILVGGAINLPVGPVLPTQVGAGSGWTDLFSGYETTYALRNSDTETGQLWAWGGGGIMGNGSTNEVYNVPTRINGFGAETGSGWASISRSGNHTIGLKSDGSAYGWGSNYTGGVFSGELGLPIFDNQGQIIFENLTRVRPTRLEAPTTFVAVGAGEGFSAMLNSDGFLISAGINEGGQLGNGSIDESPEDGQDFFANSNLGTADLTITSVIVTTAVIDLAEPLNATVTVRNVGSGTVDDDIELAAVLSPTSNFDDLSAIPLTITNGQPITDDLAAGASIATNLEIDLPAVVNAGTYFLVVRVDPNNAIEETIEDNNDSADLSDGDDDGDEPDGLLFAADLQIVSSDIVVTPVGGPFPLTAGDSINIQVTITNEDIGTVPADPDGSFALRYVLSQVADIEHSSVINLLVDDLLTPDTDESLVLVTEEVPAGGSIVQNIEFVLPDALGVGDFYAGLIVDVNEEVEESDEDNNIAFTETALIEVDGIELGEALDNFDLDFVPEGDGIWYGSEAPIFGPGGEHAAVDDDAAVSPPIAGGQSAYISTTLEETSLISFRWKANTSSPDNKLIFRYLGAEVGSADNEISGISADWVDVQRIAPAGVQIIWQYTQGTDASGDEVYLDNVQITPIADDPDFIVDDVELVEDLEGNSGSYVLDRDKLNLAFFVRNQAADYFPVLDGDMDVRVYLSLDGVFNPATDVLVDTYVYTVGEPILGGETSPNQPSIDLPTSLAPGDYRLIIVVDEDEAIDEILEDNNIYISEEPVVEIIALPDFTIVDMNP